MNEWIGLIDNLTVQIGAGGAFAWLIINTILNFIEKRDADRFKEIQFRHESDRIKIQQLFDCITALLWRRDDQNNTQSGCNDPRDIQQVMGSVVPEIETVPERTADPGSLGSDQADAGSRSGEKAY